MAKTRTYPIKKVPEIITQYFDKKYPPVNGFTFDFYKYFNHDKTVTYYGCFVRKNGELWSYADQGTIEEFNQQ